MEYQSRTSLFGKKITIRLDEDTLTVIEGTSSKTFYYKDIDCVNLRYHPERRKTHLFQGTITFKNKEKITFFNYRLGQNFERGYTDEEYILFVEKLMDNLRPYSGEIHFTGGFSQKGLKRRLFTIFGALIGSAALLLLIVESTHPQAAPALLAGYLVILVLNGFLLYPYYKRNRPTQFKPGKVPRQLLPH